MDNLGILRWFPFHSVWEYIKRHPKTSAVFGGFWLFLYVVDTRYNIAIIHSFLKPFFKQSVLRLKPALADVQAFILGKSHFIYTTSVSLQDLDLFCHMSNARYFREGDFARSEAFGNIGFYAACRRKNTLPVTSAQTIRYRVELGPLRSYYIKVKILGYDDVSLFVEQSFFSLSTNLKDPGDLLHSVVLVRYQLPKKVELASVFQEMGLTIVDATKPLSELKVGEVPRTLQPPDFVAKWVEVLGAQTTHAKL